MISLLRVLITESVFVLDSIKSTLQAERLIIKKLNRLTYNYFELILNCFGRSHLK